jgi:hypothetical protein
MKYIELLFALDLLAKYYPRYYSNELFLLAEDVFKWLNDELPEDSSTMRYLRNCFDSPTDALKSIVNEIQLFSEPHAHPN